MIRARDHIKSPFKVELVSASTRRALLTVAIDAICKQKKEVVTSKGMY